MPTLDDLIGHYNYVITIFLMMAGLYIVVARGNMVKKLVGLSIFQTSVYLLYIEPAKIIGGTAPDHRSRLHASTPIRCRTC